MELSIEVGTNTGDRVKGSVASIEDYSKIFRDYDDKGLLQRRATPLNLETLNPNDRVLLVQTLARNFSSALKNIADNATEIELLEGVSKEDALIQKYIPAENLEPLNRGMLSLIIPYMDSLELFCEVALDESFDETERNELIEMISRTSIVAVPGENGETIISLNIFSATNALAFTNGDIDNGLHSIPSLVKATWDHVMKYIDLSNVQSLENIKATEKRTRYMQMIQNLEFLAKDKNPLSEFIEQMSHHEKLTYNLKEKLYIRAIETILSLKFSFDSNKILTGEDLVNFQINLAGNELSEIIHAVNGATGNLVRYVQDLFKNIVGNRVGGPMLAAFNWQVIIERMRKNSEG